MHLQQPSSSLSSPTVIPAFVAPQVLYTLRSQVRSTAILLGLNPRSDDPSSRSGDPSGDPSGPRILICESEDALAGLKIDFRTAVALFDDAYLCRSYTFRRARSFRSRTQPSWAASAQWAVAIRAPSTPSSAHDEKTARITRQLHVALLDQFLQFVQAEIIRTEPLPKKLRKPRVRSRGRIYRSRHVSS